MQRNWIVIAAAVLAAWPAGLAAQETPRPSRPPRAFAYAFSDNRGRIGVVVRTDANAETDKIGAKIEGVTPGGPADKAGLKVGDIITAFNGKALGGVKAEDDEESGPGKRLIELAHKLEPGDTVQLEYRRGGETKKVALVAEELGADFRVEIPDMRGMIMPRMPGMDFHFSFGSPWGDLELVGLNPDLGEYFGTKEGVLVVKAPADSSLPLRSGDVILSIGGRKPTNPSHAMRILQSYDEGETVAIDIMRKQKRMTLTWKVPSREERRPRRRGEREEQSEFRRLPLLPLRHWQRV
jgi:S1-C subfamily serine protease